jgi:CO/xanthine dehydrogenase Mo-binding subunit
VAAAREHGASRHDAAPANPDVKEWKWTDEDFDAAVDGQLPTGRPTDEWTFGDLEKGFAEADLVLDETFVGPNTSHVPLETRSAMAYWQNGKLYMHCSTQSVMRTVSAVARWVGIKPEDVVIISDTRAAASAARARARCSRSSRRSSRRRPACRS